MKTHLHILNLIAGAIGFLLSGCLYKPAVVATRHFVLTPIANTEPSQARPGQPVVVEYVKMPGYLLRNSMVVRHGDNEINYLEDALWAERLDDCFRHTLAENLDHLLPVDVAFAGNESPVQQATVFVTVQRFDMDHQGDATLIAHWRISIPGFGATTRSGETQIRRHGPPPRGKPEVIAAVLSDVTAEFSRELASAIVDSGKSSP